MKNKKTLIGLLIALVCLILCVALLLTRCGSTGSKDEQPQNETQGQTSEPTSEPTEQGTEETEPATEATEASTDPTVPATEPEEQTPGSGGTSPGGNGGFIGGGGSIGGGSEENPSDDEPADSQSEVDPAGTEKNAYTEILSELPDAIGSVKIPADGTIYYNVYQTEDTVLTIEDKDAYIIYNGTTYTADESGVVTVPLAAGEENVPASFQLGSKASAEKAYKMSFTAPVGSASNPEKLTSLEKVTASIEADNLNGYYYSWTAYENGTLTLALESIDPADARCEILLRLGETTVKYSDSPDGTVSMEVQENDEVIIVVSVEPEGTAAEVVFRTSFAPGFGTSENPFVQTVLDMPGSFETVEIPAGKGLYYEVYNVGGSILTIENPNAYVVYGGVTYGPDESGVISLYMEPVDSKSPVPLMIGNSGENAQSVCLSFALPLGSINNPLVIEDISEVTVDVPEGCESGYYLQWTATDDGVLSFTGTAEPEEVTFDVILNCGDAYAWLSDGAPVSVNVVRGDVVKLQIVLDPDADWNYPAAKVTLSGALEITYGTANNPYSEVVAEMPGTVTTVEIPAGQSVYYDINNVSGSIMTIEDPNVFIIYNGATYVPDKTGVLTLEVKADNSRSPVSVQIGNSGETAHSFTLSFTPTTGSVSNPETVSSLYKLNTSLEANNSGYYYSWTASEDGAVSFWVDEEKSTKVPYDIILSSSGSFSSPALSESENDVVSITVKAGDVVTIHVITVSDSGTNPAGYLAVRGAVFTGTGTNTDPYTTIVNEIPGGLATVEIPNGEEISYGVYRIGGTILTIEGEDAYVIYKGVTYTAENGVVTVKLDPAMPMETSNLIVGNTLTDQEKADKLEAETEAYLIRMEYPLGAYGNPEVLTDISSLTANISAGNDTGYFYSWTAQEPGVVSFWVTGATEGVGYDISLTRKDNNEQVTLSGSEDETVSIEVEAGSEVSIVVTSLPNERGEYPAAVIQISGAFTASSAQESAALLLVKAAIPQENPGEEAQPGAEQTGGTESEAGAEPDGPAEAEPTEEAGNPPAEESVASDADTSNEDDEDRHETEPSTEETDMDLSIS